MPSVGKKATCRIRAQKRNPARIGLLGMGGDRVAPTEPAVGVPDKPPMSLAPCPEVSDARTHRWAGLLLGAVDQCGIPSLPRSAPIIVLLACTLGLLGLTQPGGALCEWIAPVREEHVLSERPTRSSRSDSRSVRWLRLMDGHHY